MARMLLSITAHPLSPQEHQLQHAQLTGKLARLLEELQAHESEPEHASLRSFPGRGLTPSLDQATDVTSSKPVRHRRGVWRAEWQPLLRQVREDRGREIAKRSHGR